MGPLPGDDLDGVDRDRLVGVAFRLLGSRADAHDAVQEAFARWYAQPAEVRDAVRSPMGWLVTVVGRISLDVLKSARRRRERYVGPWLPEPLPTATPGRGGPTPSVDPQDQLTLDESVTTAMLVVLEAMTPAERVSFVLHDVFGLTFAEIAEIVGRSPTACRQLASTGRRRARSVGSAERAVSGRQSESVVALMRAWDARDLPALIRVLDPDVVAIVDGGGQVSAPTEPVAGAPAVAAMLLAAFERAPGLTLTVAGVNGDPGLVVSGRDGAVLAVVGATASSTGITQVLVTRNPAKLTAWANPRRPDDRGA